MMSDINAIQREQEFVNRALKAREDRRKDRDSGKYSLAKALINPVNTMAGDVTPSLGDLGDKSDDVCFANVIREDGDKFYIGKRPIHDHNADLLVSSWRSEIGSLFYRSNINNQLGLTGKCRIIYGKPNVVRDVEEDLYADLKTRIQNLTRNPSADVSDSVLDELEKGSSGSLKEIIRTIHSSQYEIISATRSGLHIIQGAPGTGKTVVGVHRASWLLFPGNDEHLTSDKVLIVGPNATFIKYIENVVPNLGDEKIEHKDLSSLGPKVTVKAEEDRELAKLKGDPRIKVLLLSGMKDKVKFPEKDMVFTPPNKSGPIVLSNDEIVEKLNEIIDNSILGGGRTPYNSSRLIFKNWLLNTINQKLRETSNLENRMSKSIPFMKDREVEPFTERIWPSLSPTSFLREFYSSINRILSAAKDLNFQVKELISLERKPASLVSLEKWSISDIAILDFLENHMQGTDSSEQFDYIIVDESQDMTPMQLETIRRRSSTGDLLLMGDLAQSTGPWVHKSWAEIAHFVDKPIARFDELEFGYRVPKQIFDIASNVLSHIDPQIKSPTLVRDVQFTPVLMACDGLDTLLDEFIRETDSLDLSSNRVGVILDDSLVDSISEKLNEKSISHSKLEIQGISLGINLIPVSQQKGLEFDVVMILDPQRIIDIPEIGLRQLYVATTRSLKSMFIYSNGSMPSELISPLKITRNVVESNSNVDVDYVDYESKELAEIKRDIEGYLKIKGLTWGDFLIQLLNSDLD